MACDVREAHLNVNKFSAHAIHCTRELSNKNIEIFEQAHFHPIHFVAAASVGPSNNMNVDKIAGKY